MLTREGSLAGQSSNRLRSAAAGRPLAADRVNAALLFVAVLLFALLVRAGDFGNPSIHVDEEYYLLVGDRMLHGARPYLDLWDRKPIGLFLLFAGMRALPGNGILAYQLTATLCATLTGWVVLFAARRLGASIPGALAGSCAYILWLSFLGGRGGQSPVYYNLLVAIGGYLTLSLPDRAARGAVGEILISGAAACLLAGLAIEIKYTPVVEGIFFGAAHLWYLRCAGGSPVDLMGAGFLWVMLGVGPFVAAMLFFRCLGPPAFDAFWFANFVSIGLRKGYPAATIAARLAGTAAHLLPFILCGAFARRCAVPRQTLALTTLWVAASAIAFAMIGAFFDHYALPLLVPLAILAAPALSTRWLARGFMTLGAIAFGVINLALERDDGASTYVVSRIVAKYQGTECPYVFAGDSIVYLLAQSCIPTRFAFPSTLAYAAEQGATGVDEAGEVRRILARYPPVVVTLDKPLSPWNASSMAALKVALELRYVLAASLPRHGNHLLVYVRRDRFASSQPKPRQRNAA